MNIRKRHISTVAFCLYIILVAYLCLMRPDDIPQVRPDIWGIPIDKIVHFAMFFPYPILAYSAFCPADTKKGTGLLILLVLLMTGVGVAIGTEKLQGISEYRSYDIKDFYADLTGMGAAALLTAAHIIMKKTEN